MQKRLLIFLFAFLLFIFLFATCKQNENAKLNFDEEDSSFLIRDFSIKATGEEVYMSVPLDKLNDGSYQFTSIDKEVEIRIISAIKLKTATMKNGNIKIDDKLKKIAYGKTNRMDRSPQVFTIDLLASNGMSQTIAFKAKYAKNNIRGLKINLDGKTYNINDLNGATLEISNANVDVQVIAKDIMSKVELKDETLSDVRILGFVDEKKKCAKGRIENISDSAKKITFKIEAYDRNYASVEFKVKKIGDILIKNVTLRSLEYFDKSPFNLDSSKFVKDSNGVYVSQVLKFNDWDGSGVLLIVQPEDENTKIKYSYSNIDTLPDNFIPMPKKYIYSKWNNSGGVAPNDYISLKDVFHIKSELKHGLSYLFLSFENNKTKTYYKISFEREKEDSSLCEFIKLSPRRFPLLEFYDGEEKQINLSSNGIYQIAYIFKLKNPRGSIKFYASTREGRKEIEAKKIIKGEYKGCYSIEINPLAQDSETYCEVYAVAENGRIAKPDTDLNGVYTLSVNNLFLAYSYKDNKDEYQYPSIPNYIKFDRSKIIDNKLFVRVIVPKVFKNDLDIFSIQPNPVATDLPSNMSAYVAYYTAYKLVIDVSSLSKGKKLDITMPIKNIDTDKMILTHLIAVEEE